MKELRESQLINEVVKLIEASDKYKGYKIYYEVPLFNRCIDAVLNKGSTIITIEFKIKDWHKAIEQIKTHLLVADFSYLCMPYRRVSPSFKEQLETLGVGLLLFDFERKYLLEMIKPRPSYVQYSGLKERVLKYLAQIRSEEDANQLP